MCDCHCHFIDCLKFLNCLHADSSELECCISGSDFKYCNLEADFLVCTVEYSFESYHIECSNNDI